MPKKKSHKHIIGRAETIEFKDFDVADVPAKTDTGAFHSAVHADRIKLNEKTKVLSFRLLGSHNACPSDAVETTTEAYRRVLVANSFGHEEVRFEVPLRVKIGSKVVTSPFTLADRSKKIYPVLLGRKLLNGRFMVDSEQTSIDRRELKKRFKINLPEDEEIEEPLPS